jgi:hypothetical protein
LDNFIDLWLNDEYSEITKFDDSILNKYKINELDLIILINGIPKDAAPFLSFGDEYEDGLKILTQYNIDTSDIISIGSNGYGDVICLNLQTREIICFNHDSNFRIDYLAKELITFLQFLIIFREFIEKVNEDESQTEKYISDYMKKMHKVDPTNKWKDYWNEQYKSMIF